MLGLITLGLMIIMIYGLVSLAVRGKVATTHAPAATGPLSICMILKDQHALTPLQLEHNLQVISKFEGAEFLLMVQGVEAEVHAYEEMQKRFPHLKVYMVPNHPQVASVSGWMMQELLHLAKGEHIILLHSQLDLDESMINSAVNENIQNNKAVYGLSQTKREFFLSESIFALTPQLLISSLKIPQKWKNSIRLSALSDFTSYFLLLSRKQLQSLGQIDLAATGVVSTLCQELSQRDELRLMYGERHLTRRIPPTRSLLVYEVRQQWGRLLLAKDKTALVLFIAALIVWSFPWMFAITHPYWALVGFFLMGVYRFFTKIVFQESWPNVILHPLACVFWWYGLAQALWARRSA